MPLLSVPIGQNAPQEVHAIIEIPKGSSNKYEYDLNLHINEARCRQAGCGPP
jgi:inorganic pyrophosphatase